ncbi:calcium-binding protein [Bradyrhizobium sp. USDA 4353]
MSWQTVRAAITFWPNGDGWSTGGTNSGIPFSGSERDRIYALLEQLYVGSTYARDLLEAGTSQGRTIKFYQTNLRSLDGSLNSPGFAPLPLGNGVVGINFEGMSHEYYFNNAGKLVQSNEAITIIHELFHAISRDSDPHGSAKGGRTTDADLNNPKFDDAGSAVTDANVVAAQMGFDLRMSYPADIMDDDGRFSQLKVNYSYSDDQAVSVARFGDMLRDGDEDLIDMSRQSSHGTYVAFGFAGVDTILGGPGNNFLYGGSGDDKLVGGSGNNLLHGGDVGRTKIDKDGVDTADYSGSLGLAGRGAIKVTIDPGSATGAVDGVAPIMVTDNGFGGTDRLISIEKIKLGDKDDSVTVGPTFADALNKLQEIDGGGGQNTLDLRQIPKSYTFDNNKIRGFKTEFKNFNVLKADPGQVTVILHGDEAASWKEVDFGDGKDTLDSDVINLKVNVGSGTYRIKSLGKGSVVNNDNGGTVTIDVSDDILINGANAKNTVLEVGGKVLHGAFGSLNSESPWVTDVMTGVRYAINYLGNLVIQAADGAMTYIANYQGGPSVPVADQTAGILVGRYNITAYRLLDPRPNVGNVIDMFKLGNEISYTQTGHKVFDASADPLVLDLSGNGIRLTAESVVSPLFDMNNTGFAIHTGWVQSGTGLLVLDKNDNGRIDNGSELLGAPAPVGFAALATMDLNADGVIDAKDLAYAELKVWDDANGNASVDAGELLTLEQAGIASINVGATTQTGVSIAGNIVNATGSFTRADGTIGAIDDVSFTVDPLHSTYLGDTSISAEAAAMPNLKGYGTLTDLQVAMTLDPTLIDTFKANIGRLNQISVDGLRDAAMPLLTAWAQAVKLPDEHGVLRTVDSSAQHKPVPILVHTGSAGDMVVSDFAYEVTDPATGAVYWALASGKTVPDNPQPSMDQILSQTFSNGDSWTVLTPEQLAFMERYLGQPLPFDTASDPKSLLPAMSAFISGAFEALNTEAVRLAMQAGPLSQYFPGLAYDVASDHFTATTDEQLAPMYEAIFRAAPQDAAGAAAWLASWKPVIDIVLGDLDRGEGRQVSYAYMFASMVHAYETVGLPLDVRAAANALGVPGDTIVTGGSTLTGTGNAGIFYLAGGDQTVTDNHASGNIVMGGHFGHDVITTDQRGGDQDVLRFTSVKSTDVTAYRNGKDLIIKVNGTDESVTVTNEFTGVLPGLFGFGNVNDSWGVAQVVFSDGVVWDKPDIAFAASHPDASPVITGTDDMDVLDSGTGGVHYLSGGDSGDIYKFGLGYGYDTLLDNQQYFTNDAADYVRFGAGVSRSDVTFFRFGSSADLYLGLADGATMRIADEFGVAFTVLGNFGFNRIEEFGFAAGGQTAWDSVAQQLIDDAVALPGGWVYGSNNDDIIDTGAAGGSHYLNGLAGNDTYVFGRGYGHQTIDITSGGLLFPSDATLQFGDDVTVADLTWSKVGQDLVIKIAGSNDSLTVLNQFGVANQSSPVQRFSFADGTTIDAATLTQQAFVGTVEGDTIDARIENYDGGSVVQGGAGDDVAFGNGGDTYIFNRGDGQDVILDQGSNTIQFGPSIDPASVHVTALGRTLVFTFDGSTDRITFTDTVSRYGDNTAISQVMFADGTVWSQADLQAHTQAGATLSISQNGQPTFIQADGGDYEIDYDIAAGYAASLPFISGLGLPGTTLTVRIAGLAAADAEIQRVDFGSTGAGILISARGSTAGGLLLDPRYGTMLPFDQLAFADGTVWSRAQVEQMLLDQAAAAPGHQTIYGFSDGVTLNAGTADRVLVGNGGANDTFLYSRGGGFDRIESAQGGGTLTFSDIASTEVTLSRLPGQRLNDLVITIDGVDGGAQGQVTLAGQFDRSQFALTRGVGRIVFADGVVWTATDIAALVLASEQSSGNSIVYGFDGDDVLAAGASSKELVGGAGSDTYVWSIGDGVTRIDDQGGTHSYSPFGSWETNTLRLKGVAPTDVTVARDATPGSTDLILRVAGQKPIILTGQTTPYGHSGIEQVIFDDGTVWDAARLLLAADGIPDVPNGTTARSFAGAAANTTLTGTEQSETYFWGTGDGNDTIAESMIQGRQAADVVRLVGLNPADVTFGIVAVGVSYNQRRDLVIINNATGETLTVTSQFDLASKNGSNGSPGGGLGIEAVVFADGTIWDAQQILDHAAYVAAPGSSDVSNLNLGDGSRPILASPGVTGLHGLATAGDTYVWQPGDGSDTIYDDADAGAHVDTLLLRGVQPGDVTLADVNGNLLVTVGSTGEVITIDGQVVGASPGYSQGRGIERIAFDDGTVWTRAEILDQLPTYIPDGYQYVYGSTVGPVIIAGHGDEMFFDDDRSHTFVYQRGAGNETIYAWPGPADREMVLKLVGISSGDLTVTRDYSSPWAVEAGDLVITDNATGLTIRVADQFALDGNGQSTGAGTTRIVFDDGTTWDRAALQAAAPPRPPQDPPLTVDGFSLTIANHGQAYVIPDAVLRSYIHDTNHPVTILGLDWVDGGTAEYRNGRIIYTPQPNAWNQSISFMVRDDRGQTGYGSIWIQQGGGDFPAPPPQAVDDQFYVAVAGRPLTINAAQLLANDIDLSGDPLTITSVQDASGATVTLDAAGNVLFDATGTGKASFTYTFSDGWGNTATANVSLTVVPQTAEGDAIRIADGSQQVTALDGQDLWIAGAGDELFEGNGEAQTFVYVRGSGNDVLHFHSDTGAASSVLRLSGMSAADISVERISSSVQPSIYPSDLRITDHATGQTILVRNQFAIQENGIVAWWREPTYQDTGEGVSRIVFDDGTVWDRAAIIALAQPPAGLALPSLNYTLSVADHGHALVIPTALLVAHNYDPYGGQFTFAGIDWASGGTAELSGGNLVFTPDPAVSSGQMFEYNVRSADGQIIQNYVSLDLTPSETPPQAVRDAGFILHAGQSIVLSPGELLANDIDLSGDPIAITAVQDATGGTVSLNAAGQVVFTAGAAGAAAFSYTVDDGFGGQSTAQVGLTVAAAGNGLAGGAGNDTLFAGAGDETLSGGGGSDVYLIGASFDHITIDNAAPSGPAGARGKVDFAAGTTDQQLWFVRNGNDLDIDLIGSSDRVTIAGWYASDASAQVAAIRTADGLTLDNQLAQLVSAMATYAAGHPGFDPTTATQMPSDAALQSAISATWHT